MVLFIFINYFDETVSQILSHAGSKNKSFFVSSSKSEVSRQRQFDLQDKIFIIFYIATLIQRWNIYFINHEYQRFFVIFESSSIS